MYMPKWEGITITEHIIMIGNDFNTPCARNFETFDTEERNTSTAEMALILYFSMLKTLIFLPLFMLSSKEYI